MWISTPTWANHNGIFGAAGFNLNSYPYYNSDTKGLNYDELMATLQKVPAGDVVLLHGCCHNPTGVDPDEPQWRAIADIIVERELLPLVDMAYQGFATDLDSDAFIVRHLAERVVPLSEAPPRPDGEFVLYWAHHALRVHENPALEAAAAMALRLELPLLVYQGLGGRHRYNSDRHHRFILEAARDFERELQGVGLGLNFHLPPVEVLPVQTGQQHVPVPEASLVGQVVDRHDRFGTLHPRVAPEFRLEVGWYKSGLPIVAMHDVDVEF